MNGSEKKFLVCHIRGKLLRNGCRSLDEGAGVNVPQALSPGNLGLHLAPPPTWYVILGMWLNLTEPQFCNTEIIIAALFTACCESLIR